MKNDNGSKKGTSDSDNEMAGRLLMAVAFGAVGIVLLAVSPVLIGGFLIGLVWYGAYMEDGEPNGERLIWPISITLAAFAYVIGLFPPLDRIYEGVLLRDFNAWTAGQTASLIDTLNGVLPRKLMIHSILVSHVRLYGWTMIPVAIGTLVYLHFKGAGRGVIIYQALHALFMPLRTLAARILWVMIAIGCVGIVALFVGLSSWVAIGLGIALVFTLIHSLSVQDWNPKTAEENVRVSGPIQIGHEKGRPNKKAMLTEDQLNHHVHVVGASGFGKSVLLSHVIKNRISSGSGLLFVDLKADFETIRQVVSTAKAAGRLDDLAIFSCGNPEISSPYNVLANGTANQLKDRIMCALNWSEEFYKNEAASFLLKLLRGLALVRDLMDEPFDLGSVLKCAEDPRQITALADRVPQSEMEIRAQLQGLVSHLSRSENQKALQGLRSQLESLIYSDFGYLLKSHGAGIDLFDAIRNQKIIYILLDSRTYGESSRALGRLILQDLKAASARVDNELSKSERKQFSVVVDEFSDMATEDFIGFLDRARSSRIGVVVAHQEIADLSRISPEFARRLMNSTSTLYAFLQKLPDSSELIGGISGTKKTKEVTEQAKSNWLFGDEKTGMKSMKSIKEVDEYVIHPNVIRSLPVGECVLVQKYPTSKSAVVRVKPESKDYLSDTQVKSTLAEIRARYRIGLEATRAPLPKRTTRDNESGQPAAARQSRYWNNDADKN